MRVLAPDSHGGRWTPPQPCVRSTGLGTWPWVAVRLSFFAGGMWTVSPSQRLSGLGNTLARRSLGSGMPDGAGEVGIVPSHQERSEQARSATRLNQEGLQAEAPLHPSSPPPEVRASQVLPAAHQPPTPEKPVSGGTPSAALPRSSCLPPQTSSGCAGPAA